ncbi:hypothetical protein EJ06DRAFT_556839 [Trichodelitschia bisporula]|uniref:Uncharacterized protein n=1 Tax=Trichodelitschia bisporula TaxID=703511 RepID=A0A6G1HWV8_9PEZI|nr:hypothetical protein EJ06DRAFT_556839 [Trichodelitschia bisporula]
MAQARILALIELLRSLDTHSASTPLEAQHAHMRALTTDLDATGVFRDPAWADYQVYAIDVLQRLAFRDAGPGSPAEVAHWCLNRWLALATAQPGNARVLQGIGEWWLARAQPWLTRIYSDSSESDGTAGGTRRAQESELPLHSGDYVEARGLLNPAVEYLRRGAEAAGPGASGPLLISAARAHIDLGNVSHPRVNAEIFAQAVRYLRAARQAGVVLPEHLQRYLDEYGSVVD